MSKKNKKKKLKRATTFSRLKLYGTIVVVLWLCLAANGVSLGLPSVNADGSPMATASAFSLLPTINLTTPGGEKAKAAASRPGHVLGVVGPICSIPDSSNNYRTKSPTADQLRQFFARSGSGVTKVMCLSGDIPGKINNNELRALCEDLHITYLTTGELNRFAARSGYQEGRGFVRSATAAAKELSGGNVLVIDRSGNRAGAMIGYHLIHNHGWSVDQVIAHNNWEYLATNPGAAYQYLETVTGKSERP